jgi:uncharacterized protein (UPF0128 family)
MRIQETFFVRFINRRGSRFYLDGTFYRVESVKPELPPESFCCAEFIEKIGNQIIASFRGERIQIEVSKNPPLLS